MKIIEPSFRFDTPFGPLTHEAGQKLLVFIEQNARISHRTEDLQKESSWERFIEAVVIGHGDWSVVEHASLTGTVRTDRGITHELVRHRLFGYTQESTRFVNYGKKGGELEVIKPLAFSETSKFDWSWSQAMKSCETEYFQLLKDGARPQDARSVLPTCFAATISMTTNLRNWRLFLLMRTSKETHPDFRRFTIPMLTELKEKIPLLFDDIEPNARQIDNLRKAR